MHEVVLNRVNFFFFFFSFFLLHVTLKMPPKEFVIDSDDMDTESSMDEEGLDESVKGLKDSADESNVNSKDTKDSTHSVKDEGCTNTKDCKYSTNGESTDENCRDIKGSTDNEPKSNSIDTIASKDSKNEPKGDSKDAKGSTENEFTANSTGTKESKAAESSQGISDTKKPMYFSETDSQSFKYSTTSSPYPPDSDINLSDSSDSSDDKPVLQQTHRHPSFATALQTLYEAHPTIDRKVVRAVLVAASGMLVPARRGLQVLEDGGPESFWNAGASGSEPRTQTGGETVTIRPSARRYRSTKGVRRVRYADTGREPTYVGPEGEKRGFTNEVKGRGFTSEVRGRGSTSKGATRAFDKQRVENYDYDSDTLPFENEIQQLHMNVQKGLNETKEIVSGWVESFKRMNKNGGID